MSTVVMILLVAALAFTIFLAGKSKKRNKYYEEKYSKIIDLDEAVEESKKERDKVENLIQVLRSSYKEKKAIFDKLVSEAAIYDEEIELAELGFYKTHFDFDSSEKFKEEIAAVKEKQKKLIGDKQAIYCHREWVVDGSKSKGRTMTNRAIRLTARAFNNECEAAISNVRWNNADRLEKRIEKAFGTLNKLNESNAIYIGQPYLELKIKELRLTHEYREKKQQEKEEQAEIRRQMREEAKFEQEAEKARKEEEKYQKLLDKANAETEKAAGSALAKLQEKIATLKQDLAVAHEKNERAMSMAQQTKLGHVYVISNIGSFGENVYKIGMTRRLEPQDRVKELGDASVPFFFDVHAMIFTEDAPSLEKALHRVFDDKRMNLVNLRREFFKVSLGEIEQEVKKLSPDADFVEIAEARQYRESETMRAQSEQQAAKKDARSVLPDSI